MKLIPGIKEPHSKNILNLFSSLPPGTEAILFGSRAKGNFREGSDIDIALKGKSVSYDDCERIQSLYEDLFLPWRLDLVVYDAIQELALKEHIDRVGQVLT